MQNAIGNIIISLAIPQEAKRFLSFVIMFEVYKPALKMLFMLLKLFLQFLQTRSIPYPLNHIREHWFIIQIYPAFGSIQYFLVNAIRNKGFWGHIKRFWYSIISVKVLSRVFFYWFTSSLHGNTLPV